MLRYELAWSPDALDDLDEIWDTITQEANPDDADSFINQLIDTARKLCGNCKKGRVIPELGTDSYREIYYKGYTLVYEIMAETILIHEVFNQKRIFIRSYPRIKRH